MSLALKRLLKLADNLDKVGMYEYADRIDMIALAGGIRSRAVDDFINALKKGFQNAARSPAVLPTINEKSLPEILNVIDIIADYGNFVGPTLKSETFEEIKDEAVLAAEGMIEVGRSIVQLREAIKQEKDPEKRAELERDLEQDRKKFGEVWATVDTWRNGRRAGDAEKYSKWEKIWEARRHEIGF